MCIPYSNIVLFRYIPLLMCSVYYKRLHVHIPFRQQYSVGAGPSSIHSLRQTQESRPYHVRRSPPPQPPRLPTQFGNNVAQGSWSEDPRSHTPHHPREGSMQPRMTQTGSGQSHRPSAYGGYEGRPQEPRYAHDPPAEEIRQEQNRKRTIARDFHRPYVKEMAAAHAENRDPVIQIPVCESGTVLGLKSPWHRAARLCARQTLNFKVRSYKAKREYWMSQVHVIAQKLDHQFTYSRPLDINYLAKFLKNTLKNDRKCWKKYFFRTSGGRHHQCPVEAFTEWRKYWLSAEGKDESILMTEMRKGKNKAQRTDNSSGDQGNFVASPYQVLWFHQSVCLGIALKLIDCRF